MCPKFSSFKIRLFTRIRVHAGLAGVLAGCAHLCRVAGNTVRSYAYLSMRRSTIRLFWIMCPFRVQEKSENGSAQFLLTEIFNDGKTSWGLLPPSAISIRVNVIQRQIISGEDWLNENRKQSHSLSEIPPILIQPPPCSSTFLRRSVWTRAGCELGGGGWGVEPLC